MRNMPSPIPSIPVLYQAAIIELPRYNCYSIMVPQRVLLEVGDIIQVIRDVPHTEVVQYFVYGGWKLTINEYDWPVNQIERTCIHRLEPQNKSATTVCTCDIFALMAQGCKCGALNK